MGVSVKVPFILYGPQFLLSQRMFYACKWFQHSKKHGFEKNHGS
jgi:hypothetical protein